MKTEEIEITKTVYKWQGLLAYVLKDGVWIALDGPAETKEEYDKTIGEYDERINA